MDTLKTAIVVVLLLAVLYGVYTVLNKQPPGGQFGGHASLPEHAHNPLAIDMGHSAEAHGPPTTIPSTTPPAINPQGGRFNDPAIQHIPAALDITRGDSAGAVGIPATSGGAHPISSKTAETVGYATDRNRPSDPAFPGTTETSSSDALPNSKGDGSLNDVAPRQDTFTSMWNSAHGQMQDGHWKQALLTLSILLGRSELTEAQRQKLLDVLDPLAAKVVYSTEHHFAQPYVVSRTESLTEIAQKQKVSWILLSRINSVSNPEVMLSGTELKVVEGPFRAVVQIDAHGGGELTLFLGRLYAGRFPLTIGHEPQPTAGDYVVRRKQAGHPYYGKPEAIPAGDPSNPYGDVWIDLGHELCIHGSPANFTADNAAMGCMSLSPGDAQDVFGILTEGAQISIRR